MHQNPFYSGKWALNFTLTGRKSNHRVECVLKDYKGKKDYKSTGF